MAERHEFDPLSEVVFGTEFYRRFAIPRPEAAASPHSIYDWYYLGEHPKTGHTVYARRGVYYRKTSSKGRDQTVTVSKGSTKDGFPHTQVDVSSVSDSHQLVIIGDTHFQEFGALTTVLTHIEPEQYEELIARRTKGGFGVRIAESSAPYNGIPFTLESISRIAANGDESDPVAWYSVLRASSQLPLARRQLNAVPAFWTPASYSWDHSPKAFAYTIE